MPEIKSLNADTSVRGIIMLTLPISLARLIPELNFMFNSIFLGHVGTVELAYSALTGVYYLIFAAIGYGLSNSILSMISRQAGENNRQNIINTLRHGFIVAAALSVIAFLITFFLFKTILFHAGVKAVDIKAVSGFLNIRILGIIFLLGFQLCNSFLICIKETKWLLVGAIVESVANIVLDFWLIFGGLGIEAMGLNGAAYASVLSEIIGFVTVGFVIVYKKFSIQYDLPTVFKYKFQTLKKVIYQAAPLMAQYAISIIAWWTFYLLINKNYSYEDQAASQTMRNLFGISGVFSWAFGATTNTVLSNLIGQGKINEVLPTLKKILKISCTGMLCFVLLINAFPTFIYSLYGLSDNFGLTGVGLLRVVSSAMLLLTISVMWLNAVVATGNTKFVFLTELASTISYLIYVFVTVEVFHLEVSIVWMSEWIYWSVILVMSYLFMKKIFLPGKTSISKTTS